MENSNNIPLVPCKIEILDNPLLIEQSKELIISPGMELEQKIDMLTEIDSIATITKQQLSIRRQRVELEVENKKLDTARKTIDNIEKIIDMVSSTEVLDRVKDNIKNPLDLKLMAEAAERLTSTLRGLMNSNVLDEMGTRKKQKINFMFKSSGPVQVAAQIDTSDE